MGQRLQINISSTFKYHEEVVAAAIGEARDKTDFATNLFDWAFEMYRQKSALLGRPGLVDLIALKLKDFGPESSMPGIWPSGFPKSFLPNLKQLAVELRKKEEEQIGKFRRSRRRKQGDRPTTKTA